VAGDLWGASGGCGRVVFAGSQCGAGGGLVGCAAWHGQVAVLLRDARPTRGTGGQRSEPAGVDRSGHAGGTVGGTSTGGTWTGERTAPSDGSLSSAASSSSRTVAY